MTLGNIHSIFEHLRDTLLTEVLWQLFIFAFQIFLLKIWTQTWSHLYGIFQRSGPASNHTVGSCSPWQRLPGAIDTQAGAALWTENEGCEKGLSIICYSSRSTIFFSVLNYGLKIIIIFAAFLKPCF